LPSILEERRKKKISKGVLSVEKGGGGGEVAPAKEKKGSRNAGARFTRGKRGEGKKKKEGTAKSGEKRGKKGEPMRLDVDLWSKRGGKGGG